MDLPQHLVAILRRRVVEIISLSAGRVQTSVHFISRAQRRVSDQTPDRWFPGEVPDLAAALVFHANQDPALIHVFFSTCTANIPQIFPDVVHDKATETLGVPVAEIFPVIQASFGSPFVHVVH